MKEFKSMDKASPKNIGNLKQSKMNHFGPGRVGAQSWLGPGPGWGPYGPIWALMDPYKGPYMGPYGPLWAQMGPYGPLWVLLDRSWKIT